MSTSRARYLMNQLLSNALSKDELNELLRTMGDGQMAPEYSDLLEKYFYQLLNDQEMTESGKSKKRD